MKCEVLRSRDRDIHLSLAAKRCCSKPFEYERSLLQSREDILPPGLKPQHCIDSAVHHLTTGGLGSPRRWSRRQSGEERKAQIPRVVNPCASLPSLVPWKQGPGFHAPKLPKWRLNHVGPVELSGPLSGIVVFGAVGLQFRRLISSWSRFSRIQRSAVETCSHTTTMFFQKVRRGGRLHLSLHGP